MKNPPLFLAEMLNEKLPPFFTVSGGSGFNSISSAGEDSKNKNVPVAVATKTARTAIKAISRRLVVCPPKSLTTKYAVKYKKIAVEPCGFPKCTQQYSSISFHSSEKTGMRCSVETTCSKEQRIFNIYGIEFTG